jgi:hypothetical protein
MQIEIGLTEDTGKKDDEGQPILRPKYNFQRIAPLLRLLAAGRRLQPEEGAGHARAMMAMTADTYGNLLPDLENDAAKMAAGELTLIRPR